MAKVKVIISTIYHVTFIHVRMNVHKRSPINRRNEWGNEWRCIKFFHENKGHSPPFPFPQQVAIIFYGINIKGGKSLRSFVKDIGEMTNDSKSDPRQIVALPFRLPILVADLSFPSLSPRRNTKVLSMLSKHSYETRWFLSRWNNKETLYTMFKYYLHSSHEW